MLELDGKNVLDLTVRELIDLSRQSNAAVSTLTFAGPPDCEPKDDETPFEAVVVIRGVPETGDILRAIQEEQTRWELDGH